MVDEENSHNKGAFMYNLPIYYCKGMLIVIGKVNYIQREHLCTTYLYYDVTQPTKEFKMILAAYNTATYNSAINANEQGALYTITDLCKINDSITVQELNEQINKNRFELNIAIECIQNSCKLMEHNHSIAVVICDSNNVPKFELINDKWSNILSSIDELNEEETDASREYIENLDYEVLLAHDHINDYLIYVITADGRTDHICTEVDGYGTLTFGDEDFDFFLKQTDGGLFYLKLHNIVTTADNSRKMAMESVHSVDCKFVTKSDIRDKLEENKHKLIDTQLKKIEKYSDIYCAPLVLGAGVEGDDVYQALHSIRKIIDIDYQQYDKEVARAKEIEALEIEDGATYLYYDVSRTTRS